ncbi:igE-binding protein-like [Rattus rattus]|uniref:igE-binding protein-like n=1 Tax=Rattus rattus TaxID=10117 RepID=UPI0013F39D28|nr:igE-binding protein-like [Rattus rattus]
MALDSAVPAQPLFRKQAVCTCARLCSRKSLPTLGHASEIMAAARICVSPLILAGKRWQGTFGAENPGGYTIARRREVLPVGRESKAAGCWDLKIPEFDSSETDELSSSEEEDLEEEAAHYEEEGYYPDEQQANSLGKQKEVGGGNHAISETISPRAPPPYMERFHSDSFLTKEEQKKIQQAFSVFEIADGGHVHAPVEYVQIKELTKSVRNYGVSANFTIAQIERIASLAMTPGDWQTTVKGALPYMGQYMEGKALWYDASQVQGKVNATAEGDQRNWTVDLLTGQGQYANNQTNYNWGAYTQISVATIKANQEGSFLMSSLFLLTFGGGISYRV